MNLEKLLKSDTAPKKDDLTDDDLTALFMKCKGLLKEQGRDKSFWASISENINIAYAKLDDLVKKRTIDLSNINKQLEKDITERKKAEKALQESEKKYREAFNRAEFYKDLFTHDINNILQSILSGMQLNEMLLGQSDKLERLKKNTKIIKEQIIRGANLVSNVRKLSKLEEGEIPLRKIDVSKVLKKSITSVKNFDHERSMNIQVDSVGKELNVQANRLLEEVFDNILINAVTHNKNPMVEIKIKISKEVEECVNYLKMEFSDNAKGVDDTRKDKIFQRGTSKDKFVHGMGLGLSLVKKIIESYNGDIWVEDRIKGDYAKGSNFILLIPEVKQTGTSIRR